MDEQRLNNIPYIRNLKKRIDVGAKILELVKKHHKDILLYGKLKYVSPDKKIVERMMNLIPIEDYEAYLKFPDPKPQFFKAVLDGAKRYLNTKNIGILKVGVETIEDILKFARKYPDIAAEDEYKNLIGGSLKSGYIRQLDILGKLWLLGNNIIKLMKKEYPKNYELFSGAGLIDVSDFEKYAKRMMKFKKKGTTDNYTFAEAKQMFPLYLKNNLKRIISPTEFFLNSITVRVMKTLFGQIKRLVV